MRCILIIFILLVTYKIKFLLCNAEQLPKVDIKLGKIRGYVRTSYNGRQFAAFEGIPYAKPPIGNLRFKDPEPAEPWNGIWDATVNHHCIQYSGTMGTGVKGNEDCLYINVYIPLDKLKSSKKLDVIAFIHGGAFMIACSTCLTQPDMLMDEDVCFVAFNYRLGPFGFLSTGDNNLSGNYGLKDQVLALKWIQENIADFGGNPDSVTIAGFSAGGASVNLHMFSPLSRGLFHRAYSESGTAMNPWAIHENPAEQFRKLSELSGCSHLEDTKTVIKCLKGRPAMFLTKKLSHFYENVTFPFSPFAPVVEDSNNFYDKNNENKFLPKHPIVCEQEDTLDVPWMVSTTTVEGIFPGVFLLPKIDILDENWPTIAPYVLDYNHTIAKHKWESIALKIKEQYIGDKKFNKETFEDLLKILTDRHFVHGAELSARKMSKINESPVYYYVFNHESDVMMPLWNYKGIAHGVTTKFLYGDKTDKFSEEDMKLLPIMVKMLVSFAKTGVPKIPQTKWEPIKGMKNITYLNITSPSNIKQDTRKELCPRLFWESFYFLENQKLLMPRDEL